MKPQKWIENEIALTLAAYEKSVTAINSRAGSDENDDRTKGNQIYSSWLYRLTNRQNVPAPLAGLFILRESAFWNVTSGHLAQLFATYDGTSVNEVVIQTSPDIVTQDVPVYRYVNALQNY